MPPSGGERPCHADLHARLAHVYWIGGGSGAGKSTVARRLAAAHGLAVYSTDDAMADHARRSTPDVAPELSRFATMDMDERWATRSPEEMLRTFHWFRGECFELIVSDLQAMAAETGVIAEGFRLLPSLVAPLLADHRRAIWLLPTPRFRWAALTARGTAWDIPRRTTDPDRAQRNLLERDRLFTDRLADETSLLGLPSLEIDTPTEEAQLFADVGRMFDL